MKELKADDRVRTQERALYGQHENQVYWLGGLFFFTLGIVCGYFIAPEDWPLWRKIAAGGLFGLWCGYCIFAWRLLFYNTVEKESR